MGTGSVKYIAEPISEQTDEQKLKCDLSAGQECSEIGSPKTEAAELPVDSYYEFIKRDLLGADRSLIDDKKYLEDLIDEWLIHAPNLKLEESQKKLNQKLLNNIIKDFNMGNYDSFSNLKQFLESNEKNKDLKYVLNLKRGHLGTTVLNVFVAHDEAIHPLLKAGADLNMQDNKGKTLLHDTAIYSSEYEGLKYLLDAKTDLNIQDKKGNTPLHYYAANCNDYSRKVMDLLISKGADLNIKNNNGKTPLQIAIDSNNIIECFLTDNQKKLRDQLRKMVKATDSDEDWDNPYGPGVEDLKKFLDKHKNNQDLKIVLNVKGDSSIWPFCQFPDVKALLLKAGATDFVGNKQDNCEKCDSLLSEMYQTNQLAKLNKFLSKVVKAKSMIELQEVVNEIIASGMRLNFAKDKDYYFADHVLEKIAQLEGSYGISSDIVCALISRGAKLKNSDSLKVIDTIEREFKDHKANVIKAHVEYINYAEEFFRVAKDATSGQLCDGKIDNSVSYLEYSEDSIIDVAKITDRTRNLGIPQGEKGYGRSVIKIGKSEVEIITQDGMRNYTDLTEGSNIVLTFYTSLGEIDVRLYPDVQNKSKIIVEVSNREEILEKFKGHEEELGEDCTLGDYYVYYAIEQGYFERSGKLCQYYQTIRSSAKTVNKKQQLLQDLRNIESNIVKKEKNFDIKTHLIDIFKTLSRLSEEKENISKIDLVNTAERESKRLGLEGRYNWNELFSSEKKVPQNIEQKLPLSNDSRQNKLVSSVSNKIVKYPTEKDGNCFFHAVFGSSNSDVYQTDKAQKMRQEWHKFLSQFESLSDLKMPKLLKERLSLVFYNVFPEKGPDDLYTGNLYKEYLNKINRQDYFIYIEEVPILASLANIEIDIYYTQKLPDKIKPNPDMINADYKRNQGLWDGKLRETIYHEGFHYSRAEVTAHLQKQEHSSHYSSLSLPRCSMNELKIESHQHKALLVSGP